MMNDRFSASLRQHLVDTANERPTEGQLKAVLERVAVTGQRPPLVARLADLPGRIGPFPSTAVRWALVAAALVAATMSVAIIGAGGGATRSTVFEGTWTTTDPSDQSTMTLVVAAGMIPAVHFEDAFASGAACVADEIKVFTADGIGRVSLGRLAVSYPGGGGCGLMTVPIGDGFLDYDEATVTLNASDGLTWYRVPEGGGQPTPRPAAEESLAATMAVPPLEGTWTSTDPADQSRQTLVIAAGVTPAVHFEDDFATGAACVDDPVKVFTADGFGQVSGSRLVVSYPDGGGCGLMTVPIGPLLFDYDEATDTLIDSDGLTWFRVQLRIEP